MIKIPLDQLSTDALQGVIDDYIGREGTDYGHADYALRDKRAAVLRQLHAGDAEIWFDPRSATTTLRLVEGPTTPPQN